MIGTLSYSGTGPVEYAGVSLSTQDLNGIKSDVQALLADHVGVAAAKQSLDTVNTTEFTNSVLDRILQAPETVSEWRVGEALAEHLVRDDSGCTFPWPDSRSTRNPNSNGGGVDLIGYQLEPSPKFVFGEVKTSHQQSWPPSVVTGRHGLEAQLEGLLAPDKRVDWAIRYLTMNAIGKPWQTDFMKAMREYLADATQVIIVGVLVHVSAANAADLISRAENLATVKAANTVVRLHSVYLVDGDLVRVSGSIVEMETAA